MGEKTKQTLISDAKGLAKWFSVDIAIKIFGVTILGYHIPTKNEDYD